MLTFKEGTNPEKSYAAGTRKLTKCCLHEEQRDATEGQYRQIWHQKRTCGKKCLVRTLKSGFGDRRNLTPQFNSIVLLCKL
jgi:hypothetical protein